MIPKALIGKEVRYNIRMWVDFCMGTIRVRISVLRVDFLDVKSQVDFIHSILIPARELRTIHTVSSIL